MALFTVKVEKELDLYVLWSNNIDAPVFWGTKKELIEEYPHLNYLGEVARWERADQYGSSSLSRCYLSWDHEAFHLWEWDWPARKDGGTYSLPRKNLRAFLELADSDDDMTADYNPLLKFEPYEEN